MSTKPSVESFRVLVAAVVLDRQGRVLILRRSQRETFLPGHWGVPAGKIRFGEGLDEAVARELFEEAGLTARNLGIAGHSHFISKIGESDIHNLQLTFLLTEPEGELRLDESNDAAKWIAGDATREPEYDEFQAVVIDQALDLRRRLGSDEYRS